MKEQKQSERKYWQKWEKNHAEQKRIQVKKSNAKNFVKNDAEVWEMWELIDIYNAAHPEASLFSYNQNGTGKAELLNKARLKNLLKYFQNTVRNMRNKTTVDLLEKVKMMEPVDFEGLVLRILLKMGYTKNGGEAFVTKRSNDGGIDGIVNMDPLGTYRTLFQAKKYGSCRKVSSREIRDFGGAILEMGTGTGIFFTTSDLQKKHENLRAN